MGIRTERVKSDVLKCHFGGNTDRSRIYLRIERSSEAGGFDNSYRNSQIGLVEDIECLDTSIKSPMVSQ